jgi:hypothetical protein
VVRREIDRRNDRADMQGRRRLLPTDFGTVVHIALVSELLAQTLVRVGFRALHDDEFYGVSRRHWDRRGLSSTWEWANGGRGLPSYVQHSAPRRGAFECRRIGALLASAHASGAKPVPAVMSR